MAETEEPRCIVAAVIGAPNTGKSTFVNRAVGAKVSIVSPKVQTTRIRVRGVVLRGAVQIVFVDTPGVFVPRRRLDRAMVRVAYSEAGDADRVLFMVDARKGLDAETAAIVERLQAGGRKAILVLNKVDAVKPPVLLQLAGSLNETGLFSDTFMISAKTGDGVADVLDHVAAQAPAGPWLFPEDELSDLPLRLSAAELTREQVYLQLSQELPYAIAVETETWEQKDDGSVRIEQVIYVEREGQKPIVLGAKGSRIKEIGSRARAEIERMLDTRVHLFLFVKVRRWSEDPERYRALGLDFSA